MAGLGVDRDLRRIDAMRRLGHDGLRDSIVVAGTNRFIVAIRTGGGVAYWLFLFAQSD